MDVKEQVLEMFEKHRKVKGAPFEQEHFLDFLIGSPKYKGAIRNSFSGLRRFNAFWDDIQLSNAICFSLKDRDKNYSLEGFVERINELKGNQKACLAALRHQMRCPFDWNIFILMNVTLLVLMFVAKNVLYAAISFVLIGLLVNYKLISFHVSEKRYLKKLLALIDK